MDKLMNIQDSVRLNLEQISQMYIKGDGIEIGALNRVFPVGEGARVRYVDRMTTEELRRQYPELESSVLMNADILDDGERLETFQDATLDFVIASHFLEHCQNPILAVENMLRVLKPGGVLYVALPDKRYTFDIHRPITPLDHVIQDYEAGPAWSRQQHFAEWVRYVNQVTDEAELQRQVQRLMDMNYSIHFHAWTQTEMIELIAYLKQKLSFEVELMYRNEQHINEMIWVLRK